MDDDIPVIDIGAYRRGERTATNALARAVDDANRRVGFLVVVGHGVAPELIAEMDSVSRAFFALSLEAKLQVRCVDVATSRGYMPPQSRSLAASLAPDRGGQAPPDLVEFFAVGQPEVPDDAYHAPDAAGVHFRPNRWPARPTGFEATWSAYYRCMERLSAELMQIFALALGLPEGWFDPFLDRHCSNLFANHYQPLDIPPPPGRLRLGAHTDYGSLTLVHQDDTPGGLQVRLHGRWTEVPHVPGAYVVNLGDLMARWTSDRWVSTLHRVAVPDTGWPAPARLSVPYFQQPNYDAVIEAIPTCVGPGHAARYPPITSGQHMEAKTRSSFAYPGPDAR